MLLSRFSQKFAAEPGMNQTSFFERGKRQFEITVHTRRTTWLGDCYCTRTIPKFQNHGNNSQRYSHLRYLLPTECHTRRMGKQGAVIQKRARTLVKGLYFDYIDQIGITTVTFSPSDFMILSTKKVWPRRLQHLFIQTVLP